MDLGRVPKPFLEEHHDQLVVNLWDDIPLVAEALDVFSERLSFLLDNAG
jgi:hypothetical protein